MKTSTTNNTDHLTKQKLIYTMGILCLLQVGILFGQKLNYDDFEGAKLVRYHEKNGVLDSAMKNPKIDDVNKSQKCALYIRNATKKFDNIKMQLPGTLTGVNEYATYLGVPPKLKMKIYTNAPAGTLVEILLGSKNGNNAYPAGTNSQFQAYTTKSNAWEELEFKFSQVPLGSETAFNQVDQITLLFNPNSSTSDAYYFDDITGPALSNGKEAPIATLKKDEVKAVANKEENSKKDETPKKGNSTKKPNKN